MDNQFLNNTTDGSNPMSDLMHDEVQPGDNGTPISLPDDVKDNLNPEHPVTDSGLDETELYDAGLDAAAGITLPGATTREP